MNELELKQKQLAFLEETIAYYSSDTSRRAIMKSKQCMYRTTDGKKCAIGRHIPDELYASRMETKRCAHSDVWPAIPPELQDLGREFLAGVQILHDDSDYWNDKTGLTHAGNVKVATLKQMYSLGCI